MKSALEIVVVLYHWWSPVPFRCKCSVQQWSVSSLSLQGITGNLSTSMGSLEVCLLICLPLGAPISTIIQLRLPWSHFSLNPLIIPTCSSKLGWEWKLGAFISAWHDHVTVHLTLLNTVHYLSFQCHPKYTTPPSTFLLSHHAVL